MTHEPLAARVKRLRTIVAELEREARTFGLSPGEPGVTVEEQEGYVALVWLAKESLEEAANAMAMVVDRGK